MIEPLKTKDDFCGVCDGIKYFKPLKNSIEFDFKFFPNEVIG